MRPRRANGRIRYRTTTKRKLLFGADHGFVIVNDGSGTVAQLGRAFSLA
jgi:hypothetical protein